MLWNKWEIPFLNFLVGIFFKCLVDNLDRLFFLRSLTHFTTYTQIYQKVSQFQFWFYSLIILKTFNCVFLMTKCISEIVLPASILFVCLLWRYFMRELIWHKSLFNKKLKDGTIASIIEKEPVFPFKCWVLSKGTTGNVLNVFCMTWSLTGDWTQDLSHSNFNKAYEYCKLGNFHISIFSKLIQLF